MMSCEYYESTRENGENWVTITLDADKALPYLNSLYNTALTITKDLMDSRQMEAANQHFDFTAAVLLAQKRIELTEEVSE